MRFIALLLASLLLVQNGLTLAHLHLCQDAQGSELCAQACPSEEPAQDDRDADSAPQHDHDCCNAPLAISLQGPGLVEPEILLQASAHQTAQFLEVHFDIFHPPA